MSKIKKIISLLDRKIKIKNKDSELVKKEKNLVVDSNNVFRIFEELPFQSEEILFLNRYDENFYLNNNDRKDILYIKASLLGQNASVYVLLISENADYDAYVDKITLMRSKINIDLEFETFTYIVSAHIIQEVLRKVSSADNDYKEEELIQLFDQQLSVAIDKKVTDIHYRIGNSSAKIEFRIHGEIQFYDNLNANLVVSMMRALYNGKGAEGQKDQQFNTRSRQQTIIERIVNGKKYRLRFASAPVESNDIRITSQSDDQNDNEFIVSIRVLSTDKSSIPAISKLGYSKKQQKIFSESLLIKDGAIVFAGTTGSGKSTSLASLVTNMISLSEGKSRILSVESPVEYILDGVSQLIVHESASMTEQEIALEYEGALKTLMRLDPDVIMCNEVRNENTGMFFQKSVQSGHLMMTTVHAQSSFQIIERLTAIGMDKSVVTTTDFSKLLVYQRLIATLCTDCCVDFSEYKKANEINNYINNQYIEMIEDSLNVIKSRYNLTVEDMSKVKFRNFEGCPACNQMGISGRSVIAEVLSPNSKIMELLLIGKIHEARVYWRKNLDGKTIIEHGLEKMLKGEVCPWSLYSAVGSFQQDPDFNVLGLDFYNRNHVIPSVFSV